MSDICTSHPISFLACKCKYFFMHVRKTNICSYMFEDMYNHTMECNCAEEERGGEMCAARHISKFLVQLITFMSILLLFKMDRLKKLIIPPLVRGRMNTKCCQVNYIGKDLHVISVILAALARASALSVDGYVWAVAWYNRRGKGWPLNYIGQDM